MVWILIHRKKNIFNGICADLGIVLHKLAKQKESKILEGRLLLDLIYILISIPLKYSVSSVVGYIKWEVSCI